MSGCRRSVLGALSIGALLLGACGSEEPAGSPNPALRRLELALVGPPVESAAPAIYRALRVPDGLAPWVAPGERVEVGLVPGHESAGQALLLLDSRARAVRVPGPFDPASFNRIELELVVLVEGTLRVEGLRGEEVVASSGAVGLNPQVGPQRLAFPFPAGGAESLDALVISFDAAAGPVALIEIKLLQLSRQAQSPLAPGERGLARGGEEARAAWGLSSAHELRAAFPVGDGDELRFAARLATPPRPGEPSSTLSVVLVEANRGDSGRAEQSLVLREGWTEQRVDLTPFAGRECELALRVTPGGAEPVFALLEEPTVGRPRPSAPLVLLITSDTHRGDHLGCAASGVEIATPALDALAARGVLFERAQSSSNVTIPSHAALLTGVNPRDTGVLSNLEGLSEAAPTLAEAFRDAGWHTVAALSARHLFEVGGAGQGFDRVDAPHKPQRSGGVTLRRLQGWLPRYDGYPLFVWLHLFDPHSPYAPPEGFAEEYVQALLEGVPEAEARLWRERGLYRGEISYLDSLVAELLRGERFSGAIIAFTGDHGENLGEHGLLFNHAELYHEVVHVPLLLAWPGAPAGARVAAPISHLGLARTLLDLAGLEGVALPGRSLLTALDAGAPTEPLFALADGARSASVRLGDEYLILHLVDHRVGQGEAVHGETLLFDLGADPGCTRDLVDERPERAHRLRELLVRWLCAPEALGWVEGDRTTPEQRADLADLGYTETRGAGGALIDPECECEWCRRFRGR